jgi:NADH-quinone oxidoreductase subunit N
VAEVAFLPIAPEIALFAGALVVLIGHVTVGWGHRAWAWICAASFTLATAFSIAQWLRLDDLSEGSLHFGSDALSALPIGLSPMIVMDYFSAFAGILIFVVAGLALAAGWRLVVEFESRGAEFVALALISVAGMHLMAASANLIMMFIALETASISLYVVAGFDRRRAGGDEASMKYFLTGSFASAVFVYGVALTFAAFGSTSLYGTVSISLPLADPGTGQLGFDRVLENPGIMLAGIALMVVGLGFKVSAAPFHQWAPDVYQGAPGGAVALMSSGVKIAGFAAIARILVGAMDVPVLREDWSSALAAIAALSIVVGTVLAIAQTDLKRMLAYSGVAHAGYILTAVVAGGDGVPAMWFYLATYAFQLVGAFTVAAIVSGPRGGASALSEYAGLYQRAPILAGSLATLMIAMGGIPTTAGFVGKLGVFQAAAGNGYLWLVVLGVIAAAAGLYFYLRVIVLMFFQPAPGDGPGTTRAALEVPVPALIVLLLSVAVTVFLGLVPWPLLNWVQTALPL